jgi:hypothetical protein
VPISRTYWVRLLCIRFVIVSDNESFFLTMAKKSVKLYTDNVLDAFYDAIRNNTLDKLHIPHSDVFYVRQAVEAHYGRSFTLKHVEDAMRAEGWSEDK